MPRARARRRGPGEAAALALHLEEARHLRDELSFFQAVQRSIAKYTIGGGGKSASELVATIRNSVTIDWSQKEAVRARMRSRIKRLLRKHGYPPDKRKEAIVLVLKQAEARCLDWAA